MTTQRKQRKSGTHPRARGGYSSPPCFMHELDPDPVPAGKPDVRIKRIYDDPTTGDGFRVLVDRLWPRGITKQEAAVDVWMRELAPSAELRKWFGHDPKRWQEFRKRYLNELAPHAGELKKLRDRATRERVTLLYGARDQQFNQAVVLAEAICEA
jgi:uncharacterized protein YeaO (DUF488 family)